MFFFCFFCSFTSTSGLVWLNFVGVSVRFFSGRHCVVCWFAFVKTHHVAITNQMIFAKYYSSMWYKHQRWVAQCTRWNAQPTTECVRKFYIRISTINTHTHQHDPPKYFVKNERQRLHEKEREETKYANEKSLVYVSNSNNVIEYRYAL